jgi:rubrerythrin
LTKVPDGWVSCEKCNTTWCYNEDDTCPNCGLRRTEV